MLYTFTFTFYLAFEVGTPFEYDKVQYYKRPVYETLFDQIMAAYSTYVEDTKEMSGMSGLGIRITGTPCIGKSVFLFYVIERLKENLEYPLAVTIDADSYVLDVGGESFSNISYSKLVSNYFGNQRVIHLVDPSNRTILRETRCYTIFFTSPTAANITPFHLRNLITFVMPVWTKEEMLDCCSTLGWNVDQHMKFFEKWGGVIVRGYHQDMSMEYNLEDFLHSASLFTILSAADNRTLTHTIEHHQWILHRNPVLQENGNVNYKSHIINFPSKYVKGKIIEKLKRRPRDDVLASVRNPILLGHLYQDEVLSCFLVQGRQFDVHPYDNSDIAPCTLHIQDVQHFDNNYCCQSSVPWSLFIPTDLTKKGVDAILIQDNDHGWFIQVTINKRHSSLMLSEVQKQFPRIKNWCLCIITLTLDDFNYPHFVACRNTEVLKYTCIYSLEDAFSNV